MTFTQNQPTARQARVEFPGAVYYLLDRGDRQDGESDIAAGWLLTSLWVGAITGLVKT